MPWSVSSSMDRETQFITDYLRQTLSILKKAKWWSTGELVSLFALITGAARCMTSRFISAVALSRMRALKCWLAAAIKA